MLNVNKFEASNQLKRILYFEFVKLTNYTNNIIRIYKQYVMY